MAYAQHLDGTNIWVGLIFVAAAALLAVFMVISGWAVLRVSVKAIWTTVILLPSLWLGAIPGAPQRRAADVVWQFFRHGIEVLVYIVYVSVIGLAVQRIVSAPLPAELGGTNPFAHVLMMGGVALVALLLLAPHPRRPVRAPGRAGFVAAGRRCGGRHGHDRGVRCGRHRGACRCAGLARRSGSRGEMTPWERLDAETNDAAAVHGAPQPGFDPVPGAAATATAGASAGRRPAAGAAPGGEAAGSACRGRERGVGCAGRCGADPRRAGRRR